MKYIFHFIWSIKSLRLLVVLSVFINLFYSIVIYSSAEVLNQATASIESGTPEQLSGVIVFAALATLIFIALGLASGIIRQLLVNKSSESIELNLITKLYQLSKSKRLEIGSGAFLTRISSNTERAVNGSYQVLFQLSEGFFTVLFGAMYMLMLNPMLAGIFFLYSIAFRLVTRFFDSKIKAVAKVEVIIRNRNTLFLTEILKNTIMLRVFRVYSYFSPKFAEYETDEQTNNLKMFMLSNGYSEVMWLSKKLTEIIIPFGIGAILIARGQLSFAQVIAFTVANDLFAKGFNSLINVIINANSCLPHIEAIKDFLDESKESDATDYSDSYALSFEDVSFCHGDALVLKNVNFSIKQGSWVKITGPNGQGKSTLLQLISGFYKPSSGCILYGKSPLHKASYIPQFPELIPADAYENIALEEAPNLAACKSILRSLQMASVDPAAPQQYSQGEKQRLMIGRGVYHLDDCSVVLGDEIFSNIDKQTRSLIVQYLKKECANKTVFFVCHEDMGIDFDLCIRVENKQAVVDSGGAV